MTNQLQHVIRKEEFDNEKTIIGSVIFLSGIVVTMFVFISARFFSNSHLMKISIERRFNLTAVNELGFENREEIFCHTVVIATSSSYFAEVAIGVAI